MQDLLRFARQFSRLYHAYFRPLAAKHSLAQIDIDILLFLYNNPELNTARDIVRVRGLAKSNTSAALEGLGRRGLVESRPQPDNRRLNRLYLLPPALPLVRELKARQEEYFQLLTQGVPPWQLEAVADFFARAEATVTAELKRLNEEKES